LSAVGRNTWTENAPPLRRAYVEQGNSVACALVTHAILRHLPERQRILDLGGGDGRQALLLAQAGHSVTVVDSDASMLELARAASACDEHASMAGDIRLVLGAAEDAPALVGTNYDAVCCHSVLMYLEQPEVLLRSLMTSVRMGGLISVLSLNPDALAMRSGLERRWKEAATYLLGGKEDRSRYLQTFNHSRDAVADMLGLMGASVLTWYGVGIFSDHLAEEPDGAEFVDLCAIEWLAGARDPYRLVARCYHLIARRQS
jgi:2-polyprenyl-3-methyl-5-hydroxy-6-metoxy-1,4-benzoquinol methylase